MDTIAALDELATLQHVLLLTKREYEEYKRTTNIKLARARRRLVELERGRDELRSAVQELSERIELSKSLSVLPSNTIYIPASVEPIQDPSSSKTRFLTSQDEAYLATILSTLTADLRHEREMRRRDGEQFRLTISILQAHLSHRDLLLHIKHAPLHVPGLPPLPSIRSSPKHQSVKDDPHSPKHTYSTKAPTKHTSLHSISFPSKELTPEEALKYIHANEALEEEVRLLAIKLSQIRSQATKISQAHPAEGTDVYIHQQPSGVPPPKKGRDDTPTPQYQRSEGSPATEPVGQAWRGEGNAKDDELVQTRGRLVELQEEVKRLRTMVLGQPEVPSPTRGQEHEDQMERVWDRNKEERGDHGRLGTRPLVQQHPSSSPPDPIRPETHTTRPGGRCASPSRHPLALTSKPSSMPALTPAAPRPSMPTPPPNSTTATDPYPTIDPYPRTPIRNSPESQGHHPEIYHLTELRDRADELVVERARLEDLLTTTQAQEGSSHTPRPRHYTPPHQDTFEDILLLEEECIRLRESERTLLARVRSLEARLSYCETYHAHLNPLPPSPEVDTDTTSETGGAHRHDTEHDRGEAGEETHLQSNFSVLEPDYSLSQTP